METITNVACRFGDRVVEVPRPYRHHNILQVAHQLGFRCAPEDQGFVTDAGRFVGREEALQIALASGQPLIERESRHRELFSEDLF